MRPGRLFLGGDDARLSMAQRNAMTFEASASSDVFCHDRIIEEAKNVAIFGNVYDRAAAALRRSLG